MVMYTINRTKRNAGIRNQPGVSIRELLRIVHYQKKGIAESDIRDIAKKSPLNISVNKTVNNHLDNLEKKHLVRHDFKEGIGNTWYSEVYQKINNDLKDCGIPALTKIEEELVDFLIKYSNTFLYFITTANLCKLIKHVKLLQNLEKINHDFQKNMNLLRSKYGIPTPVNGTPNLRAIGNVCISFDVVKGDLNINDSNFLKDYEAILTKFVGLEEAARIVKEDIVIVNQAKDSIDESEVLKEIEI